MHEGLMIHDEEMDMGVDEALIDLGDQVHSVLALKIQYYESILLVSWRGGRFLVVLLLEMEMGLFSVW